MTSPTDWRKYVENLATVNCIRSMTNYVPMTKAAREAYRYLTAFRATKMSGRLIARFLDDLDEKDKIIAELENRITLVCKANRSLSLPTVTDD